MPALGIPQNIFRVESMIKEDPKLTYAEKQDILKISSGAYIPFSIVAPG